MFSVLEGRLIDPANKLCMVLALTPRAPVPLYLCYWGMTGLARRLFLVNLQASARRISNR